MLVQTPCAQGLATHWGHWRRWGLMCVVTMVMLWGWMGSLPVMAAANVSLNEAQQRLEAIADEMHFIRFCGRITCKFKDITVSVTPAPSGTTDAQFVATIDAIMDRPSTMLDKAHYDLKFADNRWILLGGEELSDVSSFTFSGDRYEVYSGYNGRSRIASLENADDSLRVGYRDLYFLLMDKGRERVDRSS